jgi:phospholipid transport system substrate-binding protein
MMNHSTTSRGLSALLIALLVALAAPAWAGPPTDFVKQKSTQLFEIINQDLGPKRTESMKKEVRALVNYEELATRALGEQWQKRSPDEKKEFIALLEQLVELNYANRFQDKKAGQNYQVKYTDEKVREASKQAIVKTVVTYGGESFTLDYKLLQREGDAGFVIYDAVFDEISLEETYREAYVPIIEKEGWASLIKRMKDKLAELKKG